MIVKTHELSAGDHAVSIGRENPTVIDVTAVDVPALNPRLPQGKYRWVEIFNHDVKQTVSYAAWLDQEWEVTREGV